MKTLILSFLPFLTTAQITLSGNSTAPSVVLKNTIHFSCTAPVNAGRFTLRCKVDTGYYTLNDTILYLEPGMNLTINTSGPRWTYTGKGASENTLLHQLHALIGAFLPVAADTLAEKVDTMELNTFNLAITAYRDSALHLITHSHGSPRFRQTQKDWIDYNIRYYTQQYAENYGVDRQRLKTYFSEIEKTPPHDTARIMREMMYYLDSVHIKPMTPGIALLITNGWRGVDMNNSDLYTASREYRYMLNLALDHLVASDRYEPRSDSVNTNITSRLIKEDLLYQLTLHDLMLKGPHANDYAEKYLSYTTDTIHAAKVKAIQRKLRQYTAGTDAPLFTYPDIHHTPISLAALRGHYVYIDVWATWCSPCKKEIPFLMAMEKKYAEKNIQFVSISVDRQADSTKWQKFVIDNDLRGLQVLADQDFSSDFITSFGIAAIPRFILIDPAGRIVSTDAARPSDPTLSTQLDNLLDK